MILTFVSITLLLLTTTVAVELLGRLDNYQYLVYPGWAGRKRETNANDLLNDFEKFLVVRLEKNKGYSNVVNNQSPPVKYNNNGFIQDNQINRFIVPYPFNNLKPQNSLLYHNGYLNAYDQNKYQAQTVDNRPYPVGTNYGYNQPNIGALKVLNYQLPYENKNPIYTENYYQLPTMKNNGFLYNEDPTRNLGLNVYNPRIPLMGTKRVETNSHPTRNSDVSGNESRTPLGKTNVALNYNDQSGNPGVSGFNSKTPLVETIPVLNNNGQSGNPSVGESNPGIPLAATNKDLNNNNDQTKNPGFNGNDQRIPLGNTNDMLKSNDQAGNPGVSGSDPKTSPVETNGALNNNDQTIDQNVSGYDPRIPIVLPNGV